DHTVFRPGAGAHHEFNISRGGHEPERHARPQEEAGSRSPVVVLREQDQRPGGRVGPADVPRGLREGRRRAGRVVHLKRQGFPGVRDGGRDLAPQSGDQDFATRHGEHRVRGVRRDRGRLTLRVPAERDLTKLRSLDQSAHAITLFKFWGARWTVRSCRTAKTIAEPSAVAFTYLWPSGSCAAWIVTAARSPVPLLGLNVSDGT